MISVSRRELKYLISYHDSLKLQEELDKLLYLDKYSEAGYYNIRSLYFDSLNNKDYVEKFDGVESRQKLRIRIYDVEQEKAKFELKEKVGWYQRKRSLWISKEDVKRCIQGEYGTLLDYREELASLLYSRLMLGGYRPVALIEYERRAYVHECYNIRVTFDRKIKSSEMELDLYQREVPWTSQNEDLVILEVKYTGTLLKTISNILAKYNLVNVSFSKYGNGRPIYLHYII